MRLPPGSNWLLLKLGGKIGRAHGALELFQYRPWFSFWMQQLTDFAVMEPFRPERHDLLNFGNCRQAQLGPTSLLKKMSDEIIDV